MPGQHCKQYILVLVLVIELVIYAGSSITITSTITSTNGYRLLQNKELPGRI
jgi:hypothetical protein